MRSYIDHYCIMRKSHLDRELIFHDGYKTLRTLKKHLLTLRDLYPSENFVLVARDYDRNVIKIYDI